MVKFETNGNVGKINWNIPTKLSEISSEYLSNVTANIDVADNYSLVALCYHEKLSSIILAARKSKNEEHIGVVPLFVKSGANDNKFIDSLQTGEKLVISGSDISMGFHVAAPKNKLTISSFVASLEGDKECYQKSMTVTDLCYFIEFKLIPNVAIHARYNDKNVDVKNPYFSIEARGE